MCAHGPTIFCSFPKNLLNANSAADESSSSEGGGNSREPCERRRREERGQTRLRQCTSPYLLGGHLSSKCLVGCCVRLWRLPVWSVTRRRTRSTAGRCWRRASQAPRGSAPASRPRRAPRTTPAPISTASTVSSRPPHRGRATVSDGRPPPPPRRPLSPRWPPPRRRPPPCRPPIQWRSCGSSSARRPRWPTRSRAAARRWWRSSATGVRAAARSRRASSPQLPASAATSTSSPSTAARPRTAR